MAGFLDFIFGSSARIKGYVHAGPDDIALAKRELYKIVGKAKVKIKITGRKVTNLDIRFSWTVTGAPEQTKLFRLMIANSEYFTVTS